ESLYQQVYEGVRDDIRAHRYEVGSRLPVESELLEKYEVSAITLKRALDMLREQGYIDRRPRRGTFVISDVGTSESIRESRLPTIGCIVTNFDDSFGSHIIGAFLEPDSGANVVLKRSLGDQ
ncbi:winged helix-turn-helix domain-containing protein, partial [Rhizobium johnstonii]|uniref:winged helix-turn-helix domain-containing protein n=1 Tax=Rhizobium johnstonii TaxID=3019933 RepID=UPI003F9E53DB